MVFGWGKKKQEKKSELPIQKQVSLVDVPKIVDDVLSRRTSQTLYEIKSLRDAIHPLMKDLIKIGQTLEKDNLDVDEIDKHLRIIVVRGKKQVIDVIKKDASELPDVKNLDDAQQLDAILNQTLKKIGDVLGRQTRVIHIFAKKYAEKLKEILAQMNSNSAEIRQLLKNHDDSKILSTEILESVEKINNSEHEIKHKEQRIAELRSSIQSIDTKIISLNSSLDKIKSSDEYARYQKLLNSLESIDSEKHQIKNQVDTQFTKISRPLGRYEYVSSDKEQKNLLAKLLEDPISVLISENKDMIIIILENVRKGILSGSISVRDQEKSQDQITETIEMLDSFITIVDGYKQRLEKTKEQIRNFDKSQMEQLEKDLEKSMCEKEDAQQKISTFEYEIKQIQTNIPHIISNLESKLRKFSSVQYTLTI
ncbi:exonuclease SbcC [Nitrosopumilus sp. K4]|uniref:exonuclease SbcC n=1 Tax=Nitrosopumilus sp. K4 TaxID=2795383 RepID=UPI001BA52010|nr:exonuclease SbcC [Nitrosopumilus sp. K4]QUC65289.1 exonuclease SbcC [Nitrosopumilus sp. K4]